MIELLPDVLIQAILSHCDYQGALNLAMMNRPLLDQVEAFYGNELDNIRETHRVDQSWNYRLGMEANVPQGRHPAVLSNRHMFKVARKIHLYSFGGRDCPHGTNYLALSPDGNTLVSGGHDVFIRVWDLTTQRCIRSFGVELQGDLHSLNFCEGCIVASDSDNTICIWSVGGSLLHTIGTNDYINATVTGSNQCFVLCDHHLSAIDLHSGTTTLNVQAPWSTMFDDTMPGVLADFLIAGEWLVVMCDIFIDDSPRVITARARALTAEESGVYILSRSNLAQESFVQGKFHRMKGNEDGSCIAALGHGGEVSIFAIENGRINCVRSFAHLLGQPAEAIHRSILLVSGFKIYVGPGYGGDSTIQVFDGKSGDLVRSLHFSPQTMIHPWAMVSNGHELICAFNFDSDCHMYPIKAYPI